MRPSSFLPTLLMLAVPSAVAPRTWDILEDGSGDAPTIQAGIDSAAAGDSVLVGPGTYVENIDFKGKPIVVKGAGPGLTTIDGSGKAESCVLFMNGETNSSVIADFTLTGGRGHDTNGGVFGGAVYGMESEPTIQGNCIADNEAIPSGMEAGNGGGMYFVSYGSTYHPRIIGNQILRNRAEHKGGGIACVGAQSPLISGNVIAENATDKGDGGGIWLLVTVDGSVITDNRITGNVSGDHGGAIHAIQNGFMAPPLEIEIGGNLIAWNEALWQSGFAASGGAAWLSNTSAWLHQNTIVANRGNGPDSTSGGGIVLFRSGSPVFEMNIIALTQSRGAVWCGNGVTPTIRNNLAWQNVGGHGGGDCAAWWQSDGNIVADPLFCSPMSGDYSLAENSPALTHEAGPLGAFPLPGCSPVSVQQTTWGRIKTLYN